MLVQRALAAVGRGVEHGTVLIAEGMLTYFGPKGWLSQSLQFLHLYEGPIRLTHNYWGVLISLVISGFPFAFLLILSYITGIDPVLARAAATRSGYGLLSTNPRGSAETMSASVSVKRSIRPVYSA